MKWKVFTAELLKCGFMEEYENVEKSQRFALTRTSVLGVPTNTPSYALLLETGKLPVSCIPFFYMFPISLRLYNLFPISK